MPVSNKVLGLGLKLKNVSVYGQFFFVTQILQQDLHDFNDDHLDYTIFPNFSCAFFPQF